MLKETFPNLNAVPGVKNISDTDSASVCGGLAGLNEHGIKFFYKDGTQKYTELDVETDKEYHPGKKIAGVGINPGIDPGGATLEFKSKDNPLKPWRKAGSIGLWSGEWNWSAPRGGVEAFRVNS